MRGGVHAFPGRECPVCGHTLRLVLMAGRLMRVCPCCGFTRR